MRLQIQSNLRSGDTVLATEGLAVAAADCLLRNA